MLNTTTLTPLRMPLSPYSIAIVFAVVFGVFISWHVNHPFGFVDETYVPMVLAQNAAGGEGFVSYPEEPVVVPQSPLWLMVLAAADVFFLSVPFIAYWLSMICATATLMLTMAMYIQVYARQETPTFWNLYFFPGMASLLTALDPAWIAGSASGLDVMCRTLVLTALGYGCVTRMAPHLLCGCLLVLCMLEPAAVLFTPVVLICLLTQPRSTGSVWRVFAVWFFIPAFLFGLLCAWCFGYSIFYRLIPHVSQFIEGRQYGFDFMRPRYLFYMAVVGFVLERNSCRVHTIWILVLSALYCGYVIVAGGGQDFMFRELVPVIPLLTIVSVRGIQRMTDLLVIQSLTKSSGMTVVLMHMLLSALFIGVSAGYSMLLFQSEMIVEDKETSRTQRYFNRVIQTERDKQLGKWLRANFASDTTIAVTSNGTVPYFSGLYCYPMDNDTQAEWLLQQNPQIIMLFSHWRFSAFPIEEAEMDYTFTFAVQERLRNHPQFQEHYQFVSQSTEVGYVHFYQRIE